MNGVTIMNDVRVRRRDRRIYWAGLLVFVAVFLFTVLHNVSRVNEEDVEAASLKNFDAGYIISDYQMGNYKSMTEKEIQTFLTSENACTNTSYEDYQKLTKNQPNYTWHFENGHFVCLSEELFGDGEVIGEGETAAHIIYKAAQDYKINPQVLIVLLQKETGLITDPIPNNGDYRKATGYGCPDSAPCSSEYYGFKNQVRKAAQMFRTVLDGGWTNYPLGNNYIQYNPSKACGGSTVNIRSLATSALYRYTPYQPNASAIAAGYGSGDSCGAYGNRNFYLYFSDWFGDPVATAFVAMVTPRYMTDKKTGETKYYTVKRDTGDGLCLAEDTSKDVCVPFSGLADVDWTIGGMLFPRMMKVKTATHFINPITREELEAVEKDQEIKFSKKIILPDLGACLVKDKIGEDEELGCILETDLKEAWTEMEIPREMVVNRDVYKVDIYTGKNDTSILMNEGMVRKFISKTYYNGEWCLRTEYDEERGNNKCAVMSRLGETWNVLDVKIQKTIKTGAQKIDSLNLSKGLTMQKEEKRYFTARYYVFAKSEWCYKTEYDTSLGTNYCFLESSLK